MKLINEIGNTYGNLTVVDSVKEKGRTKWVCKCSCGTTVVRAGHDLRGGTVKRHCGCETIKRRDAIVGKVFGKLTVISFSHKDKTRRNMFNCLCICGQNHVVSARNLQREVSTHCGCDKKLRGPVLPEGHAVRNKLLSTYKRNAKHKGLEFSLTDEQCFTLFESDCFYCGEPPVERTIPKASTPYYANGIDRKDSDMGYLTNNVVPCCTFCNYTKNKTSFEEFLRWINKVHDYQKKNTATVEAQSI